MVHRTKTKSHSGAVNSWMCSIVCCQDEGYYLNMNSMWYCETHRGLALVYGMRHECNMCQLFSLLCMKETGHDENHQYNYLRRLSVPVLPPGYAPGMTYTAHIKTFCTDDFDPNTQVMQYNKKWGTFWYAECLRDEPELVRVPENSWVWVWGDTVTAWVHVEVLKKDRWVALSDKEVNTLHEILNLSDDVYRDDEGIPLPCAIRGDWGRLVLTSRVKQQSEREKWVQVVWRTRWVEARP